MEFPVTTPWFAGFMGKTSMRLYTHKHTHTQISLLIRIEDKHKKALVSGQTNRTEQPRRDRHKY
jgi:hypothetical protein